MGCRSGMAAGGLTLALGVACSGLGSQTWEASYGDDTAQWVDSLDVAPNGEFVMHGQLNGSIVFEGVPARGPVSESGDQFLVRMTPDKRALWAHRAPGDTWYDVAATDILTVASGRGRDGKIDARHAIAAYDERGEPVWSFDLPGLWGVHHVERHADTWVAAGRFRGTLQAQGQEWTSTRRGGDLVVFWLDDTGALLDLQVLPGFLAGRHMAVAPDGRVHVAGEAAQPWVVTLERGASEVAWIHTFGGPGISVEGLGAGPDGSVVVAGVYNTPSDLGRGVPAISDGVFVKRIGRDGSTEAVATYRGKKAFSPLSVSVESDGVRVHGAFVEQLDIDGKTYRASGYSDLYLATFSPDLQLSELEVWGSSYSEAAGPMVHGPVFEVMAGQCIGNRAQVSCDEMGDVWVRRRRVAP